MISRKTKYAINALVYLAKKVDEGPILISEIATAEKIPQKFLEAILLDLKKAGILASKKGKGGGYYLLKHPSEILMTDVMRVLEGPIAMVPCVSLNFYEKCDDCPDENACAVHNLMIQVRDSTLAIFKNTSLEKLTKNEF